MAWFEEDTDKWCADNIQKDGVATQLECQKLCEEEFECVGIVRMKFGTTCYVCKSDTLSPMSSYAFHRKPQGTKEMPK